MPPLALSYNTSYHLAIATTAFELLFLTQLPSFPNEDNQKIQYGETSAAEQFILLQKLQSTGHKFSEASGAKTKFQFDKHVNKHSFKIGDKVLVV